MKYYLIAGEASGDMHASNLMKSISRFDNQAEFRCFGGDLMEAAGARLCVHYRDMALMGGWEVLRRYPVIRDNRRKTREDILAFGPDVLILVDYSGFNLPMARFAKKHNIKVFYYISPKLWAWGKWRVKTVRKYVDKMFVILPFEVDFYRNQGIEAEYYGNPVMDNVEQSKGQDTAFHDFTERNGLKDKPIIALLAGSRKQEIDHLLPDMLEISDHFPDYQLVVAGAPSVQEEYYHRHLKGTQAGIVFNQTYALLKNAVAAVVTSGTATLETALLKTPQVVIYKTSPVTLFIGRFFVRIRFFSLVNLILNKSAVKELLQHDLSRDIRNELERILTDNQYRKQMLERYGEIHEILGNAGVSERVAVRMIELLHH